MRVGVQAPHVKSSPRQSFNDGRVLVSQVSRNAPLGDNEQETEKKAGFQDSQGSYMYGFGS